MTVERWTRHRSSVSRASFVAACVVAPVAVLAQTSDQVNESNNPLTPAITVNLQDQWAPRLYDSDDATNALLLRGVLPHLLGGVPQILRATLPIPTAPSAGGNKTGLGDLNLFDLVLMKREKVMLGFGPQLTLPTATDPALGTGKWQAGLAAVAIAPQSWGLLGGLITWQHSFAGPSSRPTQNNLTVQPFYIYRGQRRAKSAIYSWRETRTQVLPSTRHRAGGWVRQLCALDLFRLTAARTSVFNASSLIFSPSRKSIARRVFPSRLELKRREGSLRDAPLAKVIFTTLL